MHPHLIIAAALVVAAATPALAQNQARTVRPAAAGDVTTAAVTASPGKLPILSAFEGGRPHILRIPNPLGLPDFLCITDHPSDNCPKTSVDQGGGTQLTGDPFGDLATLFTQGGVKYIRDLRRSNYYASYPCDPAKPDPKCRKADPINSACLEAVAPLAELVIVGPPAAGDGTVAASGLPSDPSTSAVRDGSPNNSASTSKPIRDQIAGPYTVDDEGLVAKITKARLIRLAFQGPELNQGCTPLVQDTIKQVFSPTSLLLTITSGPLGPLAKAVGL